MKHILQFSYCNFETPFLLQIVVQHKQSGKIKTFYVKIKIVTKSTMSFFPRLNFMVYYLLTDNNRNTVVIIEASGTIF